MTSAPARQYGMRQRLFPLLAVLALAIRILVPAGYMPADGKGLQITLCTGDGMVAAWVDGQGNLHKGEKAPEGKGDHPCAFAGVGALAEAGSPADALEPPALISHAQPARPDRAVPGRGLAAPPPRQTGPPLFA
jgi:hypothetical protein